ncbi:flagellar protein FlaG [Paenibacillus sp. WLX2291]|uniref:flagellar protein FlaG n=1 Tax=Paenibacillus sp. WLX2291 TaxID=3296934 RepID=UPI003983ECD6
MSSINSTGIPGNFSSNSIPSTLIKKEIGDHEQTAEIALQLQVAQSPAKNSEEAIKELQKTIDAIQGPQKSLEVSVHQETHAIMIKVKNKETGELIREAPPEKILDAVAKLMEISGLIVDKKI